MAQEPDGGPAAPAEGGEGRGPARSKDEIALDLMKFIVLTTGYGKSSTTSAGFSGKASPRSPEEHAEALFQLFDRCRSAVGKKS